MFGAVLLMVLLSGLLKDLIVTFPYSGVLVVIETKDHVDEFSRSFRYFSVGLVAFFTGYFLFQDRSMPTAITAAWAAFAMSSALLHHVSGRDRRSAYRPEARS